MAMRLPYSYMRGFAEAAAYLHVAAGIGSRPLHVLDVVQGCMQDELLYVGSLVLQLAPRFEQ